jgi:hypothetical protein
LGYPQKLPDDKHQRLSHLQRQYRWPLQTSPLYPAGDLPQELLFWGA